MKVKQVVLGEEEGNSEWADAMKAILDMDKPKSKNSFVLSRADKLDPKQEEDDDEDDKQTPSRLAQANLKKEWMSRGRYKPNASEEGERERKLRRIAVAGVVQLFNAVGKHQRTTSTENTFNAKTSSGSTKMFKPLDKKSFLGLLLGNDELKKETEENEDSNAIKDEDEEGPMEESAEDNQDNAPKWDVLRNDFMMSAKLKDWDKEIDS